MSDWTEGYVNTVDYTHGYYSEMNPARVRLAFLMAGLEPPEIVNCCELGFGQGVSLAIHSAASGTSWHGNDFNPAHVINAQKLCLASGASASLCDDSFRDYAQRDDLPQFDYIALHGIWSWVSDENRAALVGFLRKNLRPGGVVYVSYNVLAGCARFLPLREFMIDSQPADALRGKPESVKAAIAELEKLIALKPRFSEGDPRIAETLTHITKADPRYIAHEYLNRDWKPMSFADAGRLLGEAKLTYACSANMQDHAESTYLHSEQKAAIDAAPTLAQRENLRDIIINRRFRYDFWVRGARRLPLLVHTEIVRHLRFVFCSDKANALSKTAMNIGVSKLTEANYAAILDALDANRIQSFGTIADALKPHGLSPSNVFQMLTMLTHRGHAALCRPDNLVEKTRPAAERFNTHVLETARSKGDVNVLASPVTGGGFGIGRIDQLMLLGMREGAKTPEQISAFVWACLARQNERLTKEGKTIETEAENLDLLRKQAELFQANILPVLKALAIA
ncbi:MAG: class I SAM-dependent methyltransferase [Bosea sp. (in: a-proteobacteria)]